MANAVIAWHGNGTIRYIPFPEDLKSRYQSFTEADIGMALAVRNLMHDLRSAGEVTGGPRPFAPRDRSVKMFLTFNKTDDAERAQDIATAYLAASYQLMKQQRLADQLIAGAGFGAGASRRAERLPSSKRSGFQASVAAVRPQTAIATTTHAPPRPMAFTR